MNTLWTLTAAASISLWSAWNTQEMEQYPNIVRDTIACIHEKWTYEPYINDESTTKSMILPNGNVAKHVNWDYSYTVNWTIYRDTWELIAIDSWCTNWEDCKAVRIDVQRNPEIITTADSWCTESKKCKAVGAVSQWDTEIEVFDGFWHLSSLEDFRSRNFEDYLLLRDFEDIAAQCSTKKGKKE